MRENITTYPLSTSQQTLFLARKFSVHKSVINVATSIILHRALDMEILSKALQTAVDRWDAFGIRLVKEGKDARQYFTKRAYLSLSVLDYSGRTVGEMEEFFKKEAKRKLEIYDAPLARFYLVTTPKGDSGIFSVISHLIMDSWAINFFYKDVLDIYHSLENALPLPKEMRSYESVLQKELEYIGSERERRDIAFWQEEFKKPEPFYTHVNGLQTKGPFGKKKKTPEIRSGNAFFLRTKGSIDEHNMIGEDVAEMQDFAKENGFPSIQILFLMGFRLYLAKVNGKQKDVGFYDVVSRRGTVDEKLSGGTRVHFFPLRTIMEEDMTFLQGLNMLFDTQNTLYKHADLNPMEIINLEKKCYPVTMKESYRSASLTFQPLSLGLENQVSYDAQWYSNGAASNPFYITIMEGNGSGNLKCYYEYMNQHIKKETVLECHEFMRRAILAGIRNPQITLGEIFAL